MTQKKRKYSIVKSSFFWLISGVSYFVSVWFSVHIFWDNTMRNGEPGNLMNVVRADKLSITALYRSHVFWWLIGFGILAMLMLFLFWQTNKSKEDQEALLKCARFERRFSTSIFIAVYSSFLRHFFDVAFSAQATTNCILMIIQALASGFAIVILLTSMGRLHKKRSIKINTPDPHTNYSILDVLFIVIRIIAEVLPIIDLLSNINVISQWVYNIFSFLYVPSPFMIRNVYDAFVMFLPLFALILLRLNMKYNAPPVIGNSYEYKRKLFKEFYTFSTFH